MAVATLEKTAVGHQYYRDNRRPGCPGAPGMAGYRVHPVWPWVQNILVTTPPPPPPLPSQLECMVPRGECYVRDGIILLGNHGVTYPFIISFHSQPPNCYLINTQTHCELQFVLPFIAVSITYSDELANCGKVIWCTVHASMVDVIFTVQYSAAPCFSVA